MFNNRIWTKVEVKILAIELIIEIINAELEKNPPLKKAIYLTERKEINLKKLKTCKNLQTKV